MKTKLRVDPPDHVLVAPLADGQLDLDDAIVRAGWNSDDPGQGVCVIDRFGREIVNPARFVEPVDIEAGQDMMAVLERRIVERLRREAGLSGQEDIEETPEEGDDFQVSDDVLYVSGYEVEMATEFPAMPAPAPRPAESAEFDLVSAERELADLTAKVEARRAEVAKAKAPEPAVSEGT